MWLLWLAVDKMETEWYCSENVRDLLFDYSTNIHGYISVVLCVFGSITGLLSIVVLRQKNMVSSTNIILAGLAVADMLIMLDYLPYSILFILMSYDDPPHFLEAIQYPWAIFQLFHIHFHTVFHAISVWTTVILAVWRYVMICWPLKSKQWCGTRRAWWALVATYVCIPIICIPSYMMYKFHDSESTETYDYEDELSDSMYNESTETYDYEDQLSDSMYDESTETYEYEDELSDSMYNNESTETYDYEDHPDLDISVPILPAPPLASSEPGISAPSDQEIFSSSSDTVPDPWAPLRFNPFFEVTMYRVGPSSLAYDEDKDENTQLFKLDQWMLGVLFRLLPCALLTVVSLRIAYSLVEARKRRRTLASAGTAQSDADRKMHRRMLLVVLFFFLVTEIPQGVVAILTGTLDRFYDECTLPLEEVIDLLVLSNSSIKFILYMTMSQEFRQTFKDLFVPKTKIPWPLCCRLSLTLDRNNRAQPGSTGTASCDTTTVDLTVLRSFGSHDNQLNIREDIRQVLDTVLLSHLDPFEKKMQSSIDSLSADVQDLRHFMALTLHGDVLKDPLRGENGSESSFVTTEDMDNDSITTTEKVISDEA